MIMDDYSGKIKKEAGGRRKRERSPSVRAIAAVTAFHLVFFGLDVPLPQGTPEIIEQAVNEIKADPAQAAQIDETKHGVKNFGASDLSAGVSLASSADPASSLLMISIATDDLHALSSKGGIAYTGGPGYLHRHIRR